MDEEMRMRKEKRDIGSDHLFKVKAVNEVVFPRATFKVARSSDRSFAKELAVVGVSYPSPPKVIKQIRPWCSPT